jgi:plastocyanin
MIRHRLIGGQMGESGNGTSGAAPSGKRERSPSYPYIALTQAIERTGELLKKAKRHEVRLADAASAWTMRPTSSATAQTAAALLAFGLIEDSGSGEGRKIKVSDLGWRALEDRRPGAKESALAEAALKPPVLAELARHWAGGRPDDGFCISELKFERGFTDEGATKLLRVFDDAIRYARLDGGGKVGGGQQEDAPNSGDTHAGSEFKPTTYKAKVGDYIQWTNAGMDQFPVPERVAWVSEDGAWLRVEGSNTGIPMNETQTVTPSAAASTSAGVIPPAGTTNDIKVLLDGNRLRITASVDAQGLKRLKKIIEANAALLEDAETSG